MFSITIVRNAMYMIEQALKRYMYQKKGVEVVSRRESIYTTMPFIGSYQGDRSRWLQEVELDVSLITMPWAFKTRT